MQKMPEGAGMVESPLYLRFSVFYASIGVLHRFDENKTGRSALYAEGIPKTQKWLNARSTGENFSEHSQAELYVSNVFGIGSMKTSLGGYHENTFS